MMYGLAGSYAYRLPFKDILRCKTSRQSLMLKAEGRGSFGKVDYENSGKIDNIEEFRKGLEVELEHGVRFKDANVTNNHPVLTGMIVFAHLKDSLDYYKLLDVAELEGDLLKAVAAGNAKKIQNEYKKLTEAKIALAKAEAARIG